MAGKCELVLCAFKCRYRLPAISGLCSVEVINTPIIRKNMEERACGFMFFIIGVTPAQDELKPLGIKWSRWEERTIDCTSANLPEDQCVLVANDAATYRDPSKYKCRREAMPQNSWNHLAKESYRIACPIGCEPDADLSVLVKTPRQNPACQKYYTYGKYRDHNENEWYLWFTAPCKTNITTWCRFQDSKDTF
uniref:Kringle domain-containing protein n=1 Tax=Syphacia muris TaxID=451379 RepID=A0A158R3S5_9BILA